MVRRGVGSGSGHAACLGVLAVGCLALAGCADKGSTSRLDPKYGVKASPRVVEPGQPIPKGGGTYRVGKPYVVAGRTYYPEENRRYRREGIASWYGDDFHGRLTANGEVYDMHGISAAHPTLPMPSYARVTNTRNGRSLIVRVNDRGPYHNDRLIDLSSKAAQLLQLHASGTGRVRVEYVGPAALEGSDDRRLMATLTHGGPAPNPSVVRVAAARPFVPASNDPARIERSPVRPVAVSELRPAFEPTRVANAPSAPPRLAPGPSSLGTLPPPAAAYAPSAPRTVAAGRGLY